MNSFNEASRVWIYQSDRELTTEEVNSLEYILKQFTTDWTAHDNLLKASARIYYNRFIVLMVDESQYGASGCSIDKSVRLMKEIENKFKINLFDRFNIAYKYNGQVKSVSRNEFEELLKEKVLNGESIVFNNLVTTIKEFENNWEVPLKNSWHNQVFASVL
ncbi:ABC transporter ATPase [Solitalea sp. MAHUQ-68]|uniref:ABC transporter ATPase n=1 Tax=Solitalea agri TaxID=2953739 RepID=A0A9X2F4P5_9SPHI|nr:ABC transporter ATPase [Solitalea agri]MCO4291783.1 ABC transporter ATPase [Solitalea agri]